MKKKKVIEENENQKIFVDRVNEREEFWNKLNLNQKRVINYYGMDGMGKTTLMFELINELEAKDSNLYYIYIDIENCSSPLDILYSIRNILSKHYKVNFKKFDLALGVYYTKIGKNQNSPEIKENSVYKTINEFFSSISLSTLFIGKVVDKIVNSSFFRQDQEFAKYLSSEFPNTILSNLHKYLAEDINIFLEKKKNSRIIFFLDTFEKLDETRIGSSSSISKTKWLYNHNKNGIMDLIENSFWVISSTEKIWDNNLDNVELLAFNKEYTFEYLKNFGISDENLCNKIFENYSHGIPMMLANCVDCYNINQNEFYENEFMKNIDEVVERLIGSLDIDSKSIVYFLACLKKWDDNLVKKLAPKCLSPFLENRYIEVKRLSFVNENLNDNTYSIAKTIRQIILMSNDDEMRLIIEKTYSVLKEYYQEIINSEEQDTSKKIFAMNEYIDINKNIDYEFIKKFLIELEKDCLYEKELDLIKKLENNSEDVSIKNNILKEKIHVYQLLGKYNLQEEYSKIYDEANNTIESKEILANSCMYNGNYLLAYDILLKLFQENSNNLSIIKNLADVESRLGYYDEALKHYEFIENQLDNGIESSIRRKEVEKSIAKIYSFKGDYEESINILKKILNIENQDIAKMLIENIEDMTIEDLNLYSDIGLTYSNSGNFQEALKIKEILLDFYGKTLNSKHPYYLNIKNDIAMIYSHLEKYEEAIQMLEEVYESRKKILGEDKPSTIAALNNLGTVKLYYEKTRKNNDNLEDLKLALEYLTKSYNLRKETLGEAHPSTMASLFNLALVQHELGNEEEAKKLANQVYNYRVIKLGENHRDTKKAEEFISELENR